MLSPRPRVLLLSYRRRVTSAHKSAASALSSGLGPDSELPKREQDGLSFHCRTLREWPGPEIPTVPSRNLAEHEAPPPFTDLALAEHLGKTGEMHKRDFAFTPRMFTLTGGLLKKEQGKDESRGKGYSPYCTPHVTCIQVQYLEKQGARHPAGVARLGGASS